MRKDPGTAIHFAVAFVLALAVGLLGYFREVWQHDLDLTLHQLVEGLSWVTGSLVGSAGAAFIILLVLYVVAQRKRGAPPSDGTGGG